MMSFKKASSVADEARELCDKFDSLKRDISYVLGEDDNAGYETPEIQKLLKQANEILDRLHEIALSQLTLTSAR